MSRIKCPPLRNNLLFLMLIISFSTGYGVSNIIVSCPKSIQVDQRLQGKVPGWESVDSDSPYYFNGITFYDGKPTDMASLKPDNETKHNSKWTFSPNASIHLVCHYNDTIVSLSKKLPDHLAGCDVTYKNEMIGSRGFIPEQIKCQVNE